MLTKLCMHVFVFQTKHWIILHYGIEDSTATTWMDVCSQDSQLRDMVLLENAQLTSDRFLGAKIQLFQQAQQRKARM
jgi:hypothetical protein